MLIFAMPLESVFCAVRIPLRFLSRQHAFACSDADDRPFHRLAVGIYHRYDNFLWKFLEPSAGADELITERTTTV